MSLPIIGAGAAATAFGAYKLGQILGRKVRETVTHKSSASMYPYYSGMKMGAEKKQSGPVGPKGMYVGTTYGGNAGSRASKPRTPTGGAPYVGSTVGGNTGRRKTPSTPATPSAPSGGSQRTRSGAKAVKGVPNRTAMVKERLRLAEQRAARGDVAGAAAYANAALAIQRKGKGTAASMRRVENVANTYSQKAAAARPTVKRKKG